MNLTIMYRIFPSGDPKFAEIEVDITVLDKNDNAPAFNNLPMDILISEATIIGTQAVTITAIDKDLGANSQFTFFGYSPDGKFAVDSKTGVVKTTALLDYEAVTR